MVDINNIIFKRNDLTPDERILYAYIIKDLEVAMYNNTKDEDGYYWYYTNEELTNLLGCSKSKLIKMKKRLEEKGLIKQKRELGGKTKYFAYERGEV